MPPSQFFGKYRGKVENNIDPMLMGRVQVSVAAVLGDGRSSWAMPCAPYAGIRGRFLRRASGWSKRLGGVRRRRSGLSHLERRVLGIR